MAKTDRLPEMLRMVLLFIISTFTLTLVAGQCEYPDVIQGKRYLTSKRKVELLDAPSLQFIDYDVNTAEIMLQLNPIFDPTLITEITCEVSVWDGTTLFYRRSAKGNNNDIACSQMTPIGSGGTLLYKDIDTQEPFEPPEDCGLPDGEYQLTYSLTDGDVQCADDETSTATVAGDTITFSSCFTGDAAYETPMSMTLQCAGTVTIEDVLPGSTSGDILLLGDFTDTDDVQYQCARFKLIGNSIYMSVDISDKLITRCNSNQTYESAVADTYVSLVLWQPGPSTEAPEVTTTEALEVTTGAPETSTEETNSTTTDEPLIGCDPDPCENEGICSETADGFECDCVGSFYGPTCSLQEDEDDGDNDDTILLVILLLVLAFIIIAVTCVAVAICQRRRKGEEQEANNDYQSMHSEGSAPNADLTNTKAWYASYSNNGSNAGNSAYNY